MVARREYTATERAEAVALASAIGAKRAAVQLSIPRRTISYWLRQPASTPVMAQAEADVATMLRTAHARALSSVMAGLDDPKARLGDKAAALRVLGEQLALAEGRATANIAVNDTTWRPPVLEEGERARLGDWLDAIEAATDEELNEAAPELRAQMGRALVAANEVMRDVG